MAFPFKPSLSKKRVYSMLSSFLLLIVTSSLGSFAARILSRIAASFTVLASGPAVSCVFAMGIIPERLTSPMVGLMPTTLFMAAGQEIEPLVSVHTATTQRFAATATAELELEPHGVRSSTYGFLVCPPRLLQPLTDLVERKLAYSLKLVFPSRNFFATKVAMV